MTNNYYDGGGNRVNRDIYQRLITDYLRRRVGPSPYIENQNGERRYVQLLPIRRRPRGSNQRVRSHRCGYRPRAAPSSTSNILRTETSSVTQTTSILPPFISTINSEETNRATAGVEASARTKPDRHGSIKANILHGNKTHKLQQLKQDLENKITIEELQEQLNAAPTPKPVKHNYNKNKEWICEEGDETSGSHPFRHLVSSRKD